MEELVKRVTDEIIRKINNPRKIFLLFMGTNKNLDFILSELKKVTSKIHSTALLTKSAQKIIGSQRIKQELNIQVYVEDEKLDFQKILQEYDLIIFPTLSMLGLSKIANLLPDSICSIIALTALQRKKTVIACSDGIWGGFDPPPPMSSALYRKSEEFLNTLRSLGIKVVNSQMLVNEIFNNLGVDSQILKSSWSSHPSPVTYGTAGKVFSGVYETMVKKEHIQQEEIKDGEHTYNGKCPHCSPLEKFSKEEFNHIGATRISVCHPTEKCSDIARMIDHTLLKPNATQEEIVKLCDEAKRFNFASVCVPPAYVPLAAQLLKNSPVKITTVVGFPLGSTTSTVKAIESRDAIANGADEIDMVINIGALKSGNYQLVLDDIKAVREATRGKILKVIIETSLLTKEEKVKACEAAKQAGADFVKTSTGFSTGGATVEDIQLMKEVVGSQMGIKASGGIRDIEFAQKLIQAGATRLGTSASVAIVKGEKTQQTY